MSAPKPLMLIDANNIGHAANGAKPLSVGTQPTQAIYGYLRMLRPLLTTFSMFSPVVLWDGGSWRNRVFSDYKKSRAKEPVTKSDYTQLMMRDQYKEQVPFIRAVTAALGIPQMHAMNYEADDLAAMLVQGSAAQGRRVLMISGDKDWIQLLNANNCWFDPIRNDRLTVKTLPQKLGWHPGKGKIAVCDGSRVEGFIGVPSTQAWLEIKALMGDKSDDIPGVGGIGPKGALDLVLEYGSVASFINGVIDKSINLEALPKKIRDLATEIEKLNTWHLNMKLMDLNAKERPAPVELSVIKGDMNLEEFRSICASLAFNSILHDVDKWVEPFKRAA